MNRTALALFLCLTLGAAARCAAAPQIPIATDDGAIVTVMVELAIVDHRLRADYRLDRMVRQFDLRTAGLSPDQDRQWQAIQSRNWSLADASLVFESGILRAKDGGAFKNFSLILEAGDTEIRAAYPAIGRIGDGFLVSPDYLLGNQTRYRTTIAFKPASDEIALAGDADPGAISANEAGRFVFL